MGGGGGDGSMSVFWQNTMMVYYSSAYHPNTNNTILRSTRFTSKSSIRNKVIVTHGNLLQTYKNFKSLVPWDGLQGHIGTEAMSADIPTLGILKCFGVTH